MLKLKRSFDTYNDNNNNNNNNTTESYNIRQPMESDYDGQKKFRHYQQIQQQQQYQQQVQQQQRNRSEYQFFNNVQSPIDEILDKIKNTEPIKLNRNNITQQQQQQQQNVNNNINSNNNSIINNNNNNHQLNNQNNNNNNIINTNSQQQQRLFTFEEVQEIVRKAVKENEEIIKAEYERIVKEKLIEQYQCFSKYNDDYLSRQMKESEYSYIS